MDQKMTQDYKFLMEDFNRKKAALDIGIESERERQKKQIQEKLAKKRQERLQKIKNDVEVKAQELKNLTDEINILKGL
jgi:hypothetical protein